MTLTAPTIEWRASTTPFATVASQAFTGSGFSGAVPCGTSSAAITLRIYNNFANAANIADATNCVIAVYDDTVHQGSASITPTTAKYLTVQALDYNGVTTGQDTVYIAVGGTAKHAIPVNSGTIGGTGTNYVSVSIQITVPSSASQGTVSQGVWVEYNSVA